VSEALNLISSMEDAKILAGGQSLIPLMKLRLASPSALVDINGLAELKYIREDKGEIAIGALTSHDEVTREPMLRRRCFLLSEATGVIADPQVRNRGTIGGSLAHADPTADLPTACTALDATVITQSEKGSRSIKCADFFRDYFTTSLRQDEIIKEVRIPIPPPRTAGAYLKLTRGHNDFAIVAVAAQITVTPKNVCENVTLVLGGVAPTPAHATGTENFLRGRDLNDESIREGAQRATEGLTPVSDARASSEFRLKMARTMSERALRIAFDRIGGGA